MANQPTKYKKFVATAATATLVASAIVPVASAATPAFSDITNYSADVQAAINALATQGIINGTSATTFEPGKEITRGQVVKLLGKWVEAQGAVAPANWKTVERFTDLPVDSADQELLKYAAIAFDAGVFQGNNGVLNSSGKISRENMALVLDRAYDKVFGTSLVELAADVTNVNVADLATAKTEAQPAIQALKDLEISVSANFNPKGNVTRANFATFLYRALNVEADITVSAINGKITVKFGTAPASTPTAADFAVTRTINGGTATTVAPTVTYNSTTKEATLTVPTVAQTDVAQTVTYSVTYKNEAAKTASFTVAAPSVAVKAIAAAAEPGATTTTVNVYFNAPVDATTATNAANYRVTPTALASLVPTKVELNTTAVGPFKANQVATLTFTGAAALGAVAGKVEVENVKSNGVTLAKSSVSYLVPGADAVAPTFSTLTPTEDLTLLTPLGTAVPATGITQGTQVTLNVTPDAGTSTLAAAQYRIVNTSGTTVVDWTDLTPVNNPLDAAKEAVTGAIDTAKVAPGTYTVQVRATDSGANTSAVGDANSTISLVVLGAIADVTAPTFTVVPTGGYSQTEVTGASAQGARTVRVTGTATDTNNIAGALASVKSVEYRVREYNTVTGAYTVSTNWTAATAVDGVFDGNAEQFKFVTPQLSSGKNYIIETRSTDAAGNIGAVKSVAVAGTGVAATTAAAGLPTALTDTFSIAADANLPTITLAGTVTGGGALGIASAPSKERGLVLTGTATDLDAVVTKVEYSVYKDLGNGSRQTIKNWGTDGVSADDAAFDELGEAYTINYSIPEVNGNGTYIIETRTTDANGSVSAIASVSHVLDIVAPTVVIAPNTATAATNDFTVTFSEVPVATDTALGANDFQITNALGGAAVALTTNAANVLTATADPKAFVLTIGLAADKDRILANNILTVVPYVGPAVSGITDAALNVVSGQYKFTSSDVE